jgi:DNA-binding Lrp family transcriptional regulator
MSEIPLNKFEKEKRVIELHLAGKTIREIASEVHMSFTPISKIIKTYERKKRLETKREVNNQNGQIKKPYLSTQSFMLFKEGKQIDDVKVLLDIPFKIAYRYRKQYLKAIGMFEAFQFYQDHSYDIPRFLSIDTFMKRNNISGNDVVNVLREANDVVNLKQIISNLNAEIEKLKQIKNNMQYSQYNQLAPLKPLPKPNYWNYQYTNNLL